MSDENGDNRASSGRGADGKHPRRRQTEMALECAAVSLLKEEGVLAGLNLRSAADRANVNRGIVYHYYGSRQELLRRALKSFRASMLDDIHQHGDLPFIERRLHFFAEVLAEPDIVYLAALLVADRDTEFTLMPDLESTIARLQRDVREGELPKGADLPALHMTILSCIYGYSLFRAKMAQELEVPLDELDRRVTRVYHRVLDALTARSRYPGPSSGEAAADLRSTPSSSSADSE
ncbi:MAG TPA: TetR/AcrR family transcriptional regulator [Gammaproteobacteria bacterium]|nr:TetR/AcrR family transcriptional regulator [Gammaproteobacteria bacterium]